MGFKKLSREVLREVYIITKLPLSHTHCLKYKHIIYSNLKDLQLNKKILQKSQMLMLTTTLDFPWMHSWVNDTLLCTDLIIDFPEASKYGSTQQMEKLAHVYD